ncbi:MAG: hypothetical protein EZS28_019926 [Streblomastix strix]|uniref:Uncharacterized protein n=1 Tax=Streblomastix strix TaxID=222440 RepID=A0A5J4VQB9_9EUKA|nr:MAG: hypothetical protein EZS28_019926 [Streblomastix strix]
MKLQRMDSGKQYLVIDEEELQRENQTEKLRRHNYNIHKYKVAPRETVQIEPELFVKDTYLSDPNLEVQKFIIDTIWRCALVTQEEENHIELIMEELLMIYNSYTSKKYKNKEIVKVDDVLIKNVSISNIDNLLWNSIEKLYRVNKDFVRLSDKLESDIGPDDF